MDEMTRLDDYASQYTAPTPARLVDQRVLGFLVEGVSPDIRGPNVLEMGVGDDRWTSEVIERVGRSHVVDGSKQLLESARERFGDVLTTYHALFEAFDPPKRFDTVLATNVLEHVESPVAVLAAIASWLEEDGQVIVIVPNAGSVHRRIGVVMGFLEKTTDLNEADHSVGHRRVYTAEDLDRDIAEAGLEVFETKNAGLKVLPNSLMTELSEDLMRAMFSVGGDLPEEMQASLIRYCRKQKGLAGESDGH